MLRASFLVLVVSLGVAAVAATTPPARSIPLKIVTPANSPFAVHGDFTGTYQLHPAYIEVSFDAAALKAVGVRTNPRPYFIKEVRLALATSHEKGWRTTTRVVVAAPSRIMQIGETLPLEPRTVRLPAPASLDLSSHWLVVEIVNGVVDPARPDEPNSSLCYVHSSRAVFAAADPNSPFSVIPRATPTRPGNR